jgi:hypothetical protein
VRSDRKPPCPILRSLLALAALALPASALPAAEQSSSTSFHGIWQGEIGSLPVRACFGAPASQPSGGYFYLSRLQFIPLEGRGEHVGTYGEGPAGVNAGQWRLAMSGGGVLKGEWSGRGRTLPIRLTRMAAPSSGEETACASRAFHAPRLGGVRAIARPAAVGRFAYTRLVLDHGGRFKGTRVETFRLPGEGAAERRINAVLRKPLGDGEGSWWDCIRSSHEAGADEGAEDETLAPTLVTRRWLVVRHYTDSYCGGAHPNTETAFLTFDRATGRLVNPLGWLNQRAVTREDAGAGEAGTERLQPGFRRVLLAGWKPSEKECRATVSQEDYWSVEVTSTGLVFSPALPRVVMACTEAFKITYSRLGPYLTAQGTGYAAEIEAESVAGRGGRVIGQKRKP